MYAWIHVCPSVHPPFCPSIHLSICPLAVSPSVCLSVCPSRSSVGTSVCLPGCPPNQYLKFYVNKQLFIFKMLSFPIFETMFVSECDKKLKLLSVLIFCTHVKKYSKQILVWFSQAFFNKNLTKPCQAMSDGPWTPPYGLAPHCPQILVLVAVIVWQWQSL